MAPGAPHLRTDLVYTNSDPVQNIHRQSQTIPALLAVKLNGFKQNCNITFNTKSIFYNYLELNKILRYKIVSQTNKRYYSDCLKTVFPFSLYVPVWLVRLSGIVIKAPDNFCF